MAAKKKAAARKVRIDSVSKPRSKGEVYRTIAENTELSRKQVQSVFERLGAVIAQVLRTGCWAFADTLISAISCETTGRSVTSVTLSTSSNL